MKLALVALTAAVMLFSTGGSACGRKTGSEGTPAPSARPIPKDPALRPCVGPIKPGFDWVTIHVKGTGPNQASISMETVSDEPGYNDEAVNFTAKLFPLPFCRSVHFKPGVHVTIRIRASYRTVDWQKDPRDGHEVLSCGFKDVFGYDIPGKSMVKHGLSQVACTYTT